MPQTDEARERGRIEAGRTRAIIYALLALALCTACGASAGSTPTKTANPRQPGLTSTLQPSPLTPEQAMYLPTDPVCGTRIGPPGGLNQPRMLDVSGEAPTPAPIHDAAAGQIILQLTPGCARGDDVRIDPPSAAEIVKSAPAADGRLAGVSILACAGHFHVIGTGATPFDQTVELAYYDPGTTCPTDPSKPNSPEPSSR